MHSAHFLNFHDANPLNLQAQQLSYQQSQIKPKAYRSILNSDIDIENIDPSVLFHKDHFIKETTPSVEILCKKIQMTAEKFNQLLESKNFEKNFPIWRRPWEYKFVNSIQKWGYNQIKGLIQECVNEEAKSDKALIRAIYQTYRCCVPLFLHQNNQDLSDLCWLLEEHLDKYPYFVPFKAQSRIQRKIVLKIEKDIQEQIFERRKNIINPLTKKKNPLTYFELFCQTLSSGNNYMTANEEIKFTRMLSSGFWKILFNDERAYTLFMRCTNTLTYFEHDFGHFLITMDRMRDQPDDFERLIRNHYEVIKRLIPKLAEIKIKKRTQDRLHAAWKQVHMEISQPPILPSNFQKRSGSLFRNLFNEQNRLLLPKSFIHIAESSQEDAFKTAEILKALSKSNKRGYRNLLKDPFCTKHALQAFRMDLISKNQFTSLCLAWTAVNTYDPTLKTTRIVKCDDPTIRQYFIRNDKVGETQALIDQMISLTLKRRNSEQFVLMVEITGAEHARFMDKIKYAHFFFFPQENYWLIPSYTLMKNMLFVKYGEDCVKPLVRLGRFSTIDKFNSIKKNFYPFEINMPGIPHETSIHDVNTCTLEQMTDVKSPMINPSIWLYGLFGLNIFSSIGKSNRVFIYHFGTFLEMQSKLIKKQAILDEIDQAFHLCMDAYFIKRLLYFMTEKDSFKKILVTSTIKSSQMSNLTLEFLKKQDEGIGLIEDCTQNFLNKWKMDWNKYINKKVNYSILKKHLI